MKIGLIGYGKMGKAIERLALERGHTITFKVDSQNSLSNQDLSSTDVAIEFTQPGLAVPHIELCVKNNLPIVVGTTAWQHEHLNHVTELVHSSNGALLHASNFSVGVNIFFQINERLAKLMGEQVDYKASIEEIHHLQKLDAPSGTAVSIADGLIANNKRYTSWKSKVGEWPTVESNELPILAKREPEVPGTHIVKYTSAVDELIFTHEAKSREGFALGAIVAAEFLIDKKGVFTMRDVLAI
jgi:4-hydroxy-tetrahydrodipicolinate reductase